MANPPTNAATQTPQHKRCKHRLVQGFKECWFSPRTFFSSGFYPSFTVGRKKHPHNSANMASPVDPAYLKELHRDLARKYKLHGAKLGEIWSSLGRNERRNVIKAGAAEGQVLKDPLDRSLGNVYKIIPEWNLRDLTDPASDSLLDIMHYRANASLCEQYQRGVAGGPGDAEFINTSIYRRNLEPAEPFKYSFTLFMDEEGYGKSYDIPDRSMYREVMNGLSQAVHAGVCVPRSTGELIMCRQLYMLQSLNIVIMDILEAGSTAQQIPKSKKSEKAALQALSTLSIDEKPEKLSLADITARAFDQKCALEDYLHLCLSEPVFLKHAVNEWFFSRPEMVPDEKGRVSMAVTDRYINVALFEVIHNAVTGSAIWGYIHDLLQAFTSGPGDKVYKGIILQELSNVCHFEYRRVQAVFKRYVQLRTGEKCFKRISGVYDNGHARVKMKGKPDSLKTMDSQANYMLYLCQPETDFCRAADWIRKLDHLHQKKPEERDSMAESEIDSFNDLAVAADFIQSLARSVRLPSVNPKQGQTYLSKLKALQADLGPLAGGIDLLDFAAPIENLMEPGMADGALKEIDNFVTERAGADIGFLYQDLNESSLSEVQKQYRAQKEEDVRVELQRPVPEEPSKEERIEQRRQKIKTRPPHSSVYSITSALEKPKDLLPEVPSSPIKVSLESFEVFQTLFTKSESRGSIRWTAFQSALSELGFTIEPRCGSLYTFFPPKEDASKIPITFHRPHQARIEGDILLAFARRLARRYGWSGNTFEQKN